MKYFFLFLGIFPSLLSAQFVFGDQLPDAPELSARGPHRVGVATMEITNKDQPNLLLANGDDTPLYDRTLTLEVWYPTSSPSKGELIRYEETLGMAGDTARPLIPFQFNGRAMRGGRPDLAGGPYPLVIVSHGYVGSRYLMTYLTENLASKGYVVVAIDHKESTFKDAGPFHSTLYYRSIDQMFTLNEVERMGQRGSKSILAGLVDTRSTAVIGYSMGGYGALNVGGAGYSTQMAGFFGAQTKGSTVINKRVMDDPDYTAPDPRIKAIVAMAPWGKNFNIWDDEGLQGLRVPTLFIAGDQDDISGYENGTKAIFEGATNAERHLLTYQGARHNVAPNPPPPEALAPGLHIDEYLRYADSVWDTKRMNNVNQHFITAFLNVRLKGESDFKKYLDLPEDSNASTWTGFKPRTAVGLLWLTK